MTEIEKKALALLNEMRLEAGHCALNKHTPGTNYGSCWEALCRAIETHEAFRQEVSDAVEAYVTGGGSSGEDEWGRLKRLIITKPDPLVEALVEGGIVKYGSAEIAADLRKALAARGLEIVEKK